MEYIKWNIVYVGQAVTDTDLMVLYYLEQYTLDIS